VIGAFQAHFGHQARQHHMQGLRRTQNHHESVRSAQALTRHDHLSIGVKLTASDALQVPNGVNHPHADIVPGGAGGRQRFRLGDETIALGHPLQEQQIGVDRATIGDQNGFDGLLFGHALAPRQPGNRFHHHPHYSPPAPDK